MIIVNKGITTMINFFKKKNKPTKQKDTKGITKEPQKEIKSPKTTVDFLRESNDFKVVEYKNKKTGITFQLTFVISLIDEKIIQESALPFLLEENFSQIEDLPHLLPISDMEITTDLSQLEPKLLNGYVLLTVENKKDKVCFFAAQKHVTRSITIPEIEFSVVGPKESFVEALSENLNLVRKKLPIKELIIEEFEVGHLSKTKVAVLYLEGITNEEDVNTVKQRISDIEIDAIVDSSYIGQIIGDSAYSLVPQILDTERPDRTIAGLVEGKVVVIVDGSPHALLAPTTVIEFFSSFEDYFLNWMTSSFFRLLRVFAVVFSILMTPIYVAILTYHYELIPEDLMGILYTSRTAIPFPPLLEALFLELTIELLREAGARLPTKVGQTIGIVGGIVIGTASVEAGLTSNVLLILIGLTALASFTTPIYRMNNTIRIYRYPFLLLAQLWGLLGITFGVCFLVAELLRTTSLGRPILTPFYPLRIEDFKDSFIRLPFNRQSKRPFSLRSQNKKRFSKDKANEKKDVDE
jgi:tetrahydromethanopterin S-methyltransferase subunit G